MKHYRRVGLGTQHTNIRTWHTAVSRAGLDKESAAGSSFGPGHGVVAGTLPCEPVVHIGHTLHVIVALLATCGHVQLLGVSCHLPIIRCVTHHVDCGALELWQMFKLITKHTSVSNAATFIMLGLCSLLTMRLSYCVLLQSCCNCSHKGQSPNVW